MKIFIFAAQCVGKTILAGYLRNKTHCEVLEMDDEIMRLNGNAWPDFQYKVTKLEPAVYGLVAAMDNIVLMDNHLEMAHALKLKQSGFTLLLIEIGRDELLRRNKERFESGDQDDASQWIDLELQNAEELRSNLLIDRVIDGMQPTEKIVAEILSHASAKHSTS